MCCNRTFIYPYFVCMVCVNFLKRTLKYSFSLSLVHTCCPINIKTKIEFIEPISINYATIPWGSHIIDMFLKSNLTFPPFKSWPMTFSHIALYLRCPKFIIPVERFYVTKIRSFILIESMTSFSFLEECQLERNHQGYWNLLRIVWCPLTITYVHLLKVI